MLVKLTRNRRMKVGWIVALVYLLCVMAPALSYALPGDHAVPCMSMGSLMSGAIPMHDEAAQPMHARLDGQVHDHSAHAMAMSGDEPSTMSSAMDDDEAPAQKGPHATGGKCCALMCVSAMPASLYDIAMPPLSTEVRIVATYRAAADNAPAMHYRPPIA
ncbi:hypothetical protein [Rhodopseudomonas sp. RCAM05734]|uniref:hypothetical protein n=1 Tax=Rhodopseudomonas sp. RCAM05734 TaxID=3457549 RepID=UPI004043B8DA